MSEPLAALREFMARSHRDQMTSVDVATRAQMMQRQQHNFNRMDSQVDAVLKSRCPDHYEPPSAEDMGNVIINNGFIGHEEALKILANGSQEDETQDSDGEAGEPTAPPATTQTQAPSDNSPAATVTKPSGLSTLGKAAALTAALGGATIAGGVVNEYFDSTPAPIQYDVEAIPYQPNVIDQ